MASSRVTITFFITKLFVEGLVENGFSYFILFDWGIIDVINISAF